MVRQPYLARGPNKAARSGACLIASATSSVVICSPSQILDQRALAKSRLDVEDSPRERRIGDLVRPAITLPQAVVGRHTCSHVFQSPDHDAEFQAGCRDQVRCTSQKEGKGDFAK